MDARVKEARAGFFPALNNDSTSVHIAEQQHIEIPAGALGVYPQIGPLPGAGVSLNQGKPNFLLSTTTLSQPITQYFKTRAGVDVTRADAAGARADMRRTENDIAYKVKEIYYAILATERRRNAVDAQVRAAQLRNTETRNAVVTGVSLEVKTAEVQVQIAQATHVSGQLQDAVLNMREELADLCGLPVDADLELVKPDDATDHRLPGHGRGRERSASPAIPKSRPPPINSKKLAQECVPPAPSIYPTSARSRSIFIRTVPLSFRATTALSGST